MNAPTPPIRKILLINPPRVGGYPVERDERFEHKDTGAVYPPLAYLYVAAILEAAGYEVKLIDASGFDLSYEQVVLELDAFKPDLVFARIAFDCQDEDLKILDYARSKNILTLTRNRIISMVPEIKRKVLARAHAFIDQDPDLVIGAVIAAINGNIAAGAADVFRDVPGVSYLLRGELTATPPAPEADIDSLPVGAYHLLGSLAPYGTQLLDRPFVSIYTSKGCPFGCTFCAYGRSPLRRRGIPHILMELEHLKTRYGLRSFLIFDDAFTLRREHAEVFCRELIARKMDLTWSCCTRVDKIDRDLLKLMKAAGCREIAFGVESGSQKIIDACAKGITVEQIKEAARLCREVGIKFYCMIVLGLPGEDRATMQETKALLKEIRPFYVQFCFAVPFPNTELYRYCKDKGLLGPAPWSEYCPLNATPVCRTENLTREELVGLRDELYKYFLFNPSILIQHLRPFDPLYMLRGLVILARKAYSLFSRKALR